MKLIKTSNTYEASFYLMFGGQFVKVRSRVLNSKRARKKGHVDNWTVTVDNVPEWAVEMWRSGNIYANITQFVDVRNKLKKRIKRELSNIS